MWTLCIALVTDMMSQVPLKYSPAIEFPKFAVNLEISLHICQSNREFQNEVNFTPNFAGKLRSSSQAKFTSFGVVGLVINYKWI